MSAQPAYSYPQYEYAPQPRTSQPRTRVTVVPGTRQRTSAPSLSPTVVFAAKVLAVVLCVVAVVAFARVSLSAAAVEVSAQSQVLETQIDEARAAGNALEVSQSTLSSPARIKQMAKSLGMAAAVETETITLAQDVVATAEDGSLSLSESVARAVSAGE